MSGGCPSECDGAAGVVFGEDADALSWFEVEWFPLACGCGGVVLVSCEADESLVVGCGRGFGGGDFEPLSNELEGEALCGDECSTEDDVVLAAFAECASSSPLGEGETPPNASYFKAFGLLWMLA